MNSEEIKKSLIDPKVITSAGGIIIALALGVGLLKVITNDLNHVRADMKAAISSQVDVQKDTNEVLREMTKALERNTQVIENLK